MNKLSLFSLFAFIGLVCLALYGVFVRPVPELDQQDVSAVADNSGVSGAVSATVVDSGNPRSETEELAALSLASWPEPALAIIATGEQRGYLEPCGCTGGQLGGMTRRAGLFHQLESRGWTVRGIDLGSSVRRLGDQARIKFETTLEAMRQMRYVSLGLGTEEIRLRADYLLSQHLTDGDVSLDFVSANLVFFGTRELGTPISYRVMEAEGLRVGITSVLGRTLRDEVFADGNSSGDIEWEDPGQSLQQVLRQMQEDGVDFPILLSQATVEESRELARQFPAFRVIVTAQGFGEGEVASETIGPVQLLQVGAKGRTAGVIGIYPEDQQQPIRFELVELSGDRFGDDSQMLALLQAYQRRLRDEGLTGDKLTVGHPSGASFVGVQKCGECHTQALKVWESTAHAHALESLDPSSGRPGSERLHGILRDRDPECISCHVTGWDPINSIRYRSGFMHADLAESSDQQVLQELLAGSQCENCHGPGSRHVELIEQGNVTAAASEVRVTMEEARERTCVRCHDGDNSPEFDFDSWWEQVAHPGLD